MNIYRISQTENVDYDTWDSAIVVASDADEARRMHPSGREYYPKYMDMPSESYDPDSLTMWKYTYNGWASKPEAVTVELVGVADPDRYTESQVICSSFNAG
jgi:hypothetical protein